MKKFTFYMLIICGLNLAGYAQNPRNVLVYNLTDTDCGPCSCMDSIIHHSLQPAWPRTIVVALHSPMINSHFREYQGNEVFHTFNANFEPSGFIDGLGYDVPYKSVTDSVGRRFEQSAEAPVSVGIYDKVWNPETRLVTFTLGLKNLGPEIKSACWFNIFVTEDNLICPHRIMTGCATPNQPGLPFKMDFVNDHVTRSLVYSSAGEVLIGPTWPSQQTLSRYCAVQLDSAWVGPNCNLVIAVYEHNDSLYKAPILQAIRQSVTGGVGIPDQKPAMAEITSIYPNPAEKWVNIHVNIDAEDQYYLKMADLTGRETETIFQGTLQPGTYNFEVKTIDYPSGSYICIFGSHGRETTGKVIIR